MFCPSRNKGFPLGRKKHVTICFFLKVRDETKKNIKIAKENEFELARLTAEEANKLRDIELAKLAAEEARVLREGSKESSGY